jgi:hypothetical protein
MRCSESLHNWRARNEAQIERLIRITRDLKDEAMSQRPDPHTWSPIQIVEHIVLAHRPYLQTIQNGLEGARRGTGDPPVRHSFFGRLLIKAVGPDSNVPAPRWLHPKPGLVWQEVLAEWQGQQAQLLSLLDQAAGVDLSGVPVRNPFIRVIRQNLADCLEIVTAHNERHVGQVEERLHRSSSAR